MIKKLENPFFQRMNEFLYSPAYFVYVGILTVLSNVFCLEIYTYTLFVLTGIYVCLFARDLLPLFPLFACGYISPSQGNNPGVNENSIFSLSCGGIYLLILLSIVAVCLVWRLVKDPNFGGKKFLTKKRNLLSGMLILGATYAISGLGSGQWTEFGWRNLVFSLVQLVAIAGLYYLLCGSVLWDKAPKAYLFWLGLCVGYVLVAELAGIYITENVLENGIIARGKIITGWGHYNNIGAMLAMVIPLPFFLTGKGHRSVFAYASSFVFLTALLFTCSRGSILVGIVVYVAAYILSVIRSQYARRRIAVHVTVVLLVGAFFVIFRQRLVQMFEVLLDSESSWERIEIYREGFKQFLRFPVFGGTFYPSDYWPFAWATAENFVNIFPPRWHNTFVQILATGGMVSLIGYGIHRVQTIKLFVKKLTTEKIFAGLAVISLLMTSMVDCHFFNIGPVLLYSGLLACVECQLDKPETL